VVSVAGLNSNGVLFTVLQLVPATVYSYSITDGSGNTGYAANGNILNYSDSVMGNWQNIQYNHLNRLMSAQVSPV